MRILIWARVFAPTLLTAIICTGFLGYSHFSANAAQQEIEAFETIDHSTGINEVVATGQGHYVVQFSNNRLVKYDAGSRPVWELSFDSSSLSLPALAVRNAVPDLLGDLLVLGVTKDRAFPGVRRATMALVRVDGDTSRAEVLGYYPGLEPASISVAPDGTAYVVAFSANRFNALVAAPSKLPERYSDNFIHELDLDGGIVRSFAPMETKPTSVQDLGDFLIEVSSRRLVFTPDERAFWHDSYSLDLLELDLESGSLTGSMIQLGSGELSAHFLVPRVDFLTPSRILYEVVLLDKALRLNRRGRPVAALVLGSEIRTLDLASGNSRQILRQPAPDRTAPVYDPSTDSILLVHVVGQSRGMKSQQWSSERFFEDRGRRIQ